MSHQIERWREAYPADYSAQVERAISLVGAKHDFFVKGKADWLRRFAGTHRSLLDIGCGIGLLHPYLTDFEVTGTDVSKEALDEAGTRNPDAAYRLHDGERLLAKDGEFDIAVAVTVMHHVAPTQWPSFVSEASRVLRAGGVFVVIEHNPWNPLTRYSVAKSELDHDAILLSSKATETLMRDTGLQGVRTEYVFFTPWQGTQLIDRALSWLPIGAQYCTYGLKPGISAI